LVGVVATMRGIALRSMACPMSYPVERFDAEPSRRGKVGFRRDTGGVRRILKSDGSSMTIP